MVNARTHKAITHFVILNEVKNLSRFNGVTEVRN
jgi:hypothetical protein